MIMQAGDRGRLPGSIARRPILGLVVVAVIIAIGLRLTGFNPAVAQAPGLTAYHAAIDPGLDLAGEAWSRVPRVELALTAQSFVYPTASTATPVVLVRAIHTDDRLYVGLEWRDPTTDESSRAVDDFPDAVAVQFPGEAATSVPFVCMGQADRAVNIWYWRADDQIGEADWRGPYLPNGYADWHPSAGEVYPADEAGNLVARSGVQNLVAGGFGTLSPADQQVVVGTGRHEDGRWSVVFARDLDAPGLNQPTFDGRSRSDIAFAVWDGSEGERNGKKSVSQFAVLDFSSDEGPGEPVGFAIVPPVVVLSNLLVFGWLRRFRRRDEVTLTDDSRTSR